MEAWEDMVLVYHNQGGEVPVACFYAPSTVNCVAFNGKQIAAGCESGHVLLLVAPSLFEPVSTQPEERELPPTTTRSSPIPTLAPSASQRTSVD